MGYICTLDNLFCFPTHTPIGKRLTQTRRKVSFLYEMDLVFIVYVIIYPILDVNNTYIRIQQTATLSYIFKQKRTDFLSPTGE